MWKKNKIDTFLEPLRHEIFTRSLCTQKVTYRRNRQKLKKIHAKRPNIHIKYTNLGAAAPQMYHVLSIYMKINPQKRPICTKRDPHTHLFWSRGATRVSNALYVYENSYTKEAYIHEKRPTNKPDLEPRRDKSITCSLYKRKTLQKRPVYVKRDLHTHLFWSRGGIRASPTF